MTKTIKDLLPFSDVQVEFLGRDMYKLGTCENCPLDIVKPCSSIFGTACEQTRAEALRLHNEFLKGKQMKNGKIGARIEDIPERENVILSNNAFYELTSCGSIYQKQRECIRNSHSALHAKVDDLENRNLILKNASHEYIDIIEELREKYKEAKRQIALEKANVAGCTEQYNTSVKFGNDTAKINQTLQEQISDLEKQNTDLQAKIDELRKEIKNLTLKNANKRYQLEERNNNLQNRITELENADAKEVEFLERKLTESESRLSDSIRKIAELEKQIINDKKETKQKYQHLSRAHTALRRQNKELQERLSGVEPIIQDTIEQALDKAMDLQKKKLAKGIICDIMHDTRDPYGRKCTKWVVAEACDTTDVTDFPYAAQCEPQRDDLYHVWGKCSPCELGVLRRFSYFKNGKFYDQHGEWWPHYKPTGYRWDAKKNKIVPIK